MRVRDLEPTKDPRGMLRFMDARRAGPKRQVGGRAR
jgi:hypothetical protein